MAALQAAADDKNHSFAVAYAPVLGQYGLIDLITEFAKEHPDKNMRVIETYRRWLY